MGWWGGQDSNLRPDYEWDSGNVLLPVETTKEAGQHWFHDSKDF